MRRALDGGLGSDVTSSGSIGAILSLIVLDCVDQLTQQFSHLLVLHPKGKTMRKPLHSTLCCGKTNIECNFLPAIAHFAAF